jgi:hypothetical protein
LIIGSRLIAQVYAKKVSGGGLAVLFLNADTNITQDLSVNLTDLKAGLGFTGPISKAGFTDEGATASFAFGLESTQAIRQLRPVIDLSSLTDGLWLQTVRDVWEKTAAGSVASSAHVFTAHAIPPQDSKLMLFTPAGGAEAVEMTQLTEGFSGSV